MQGRHHRLSIGRAEVIAEEVRGWPGLIRYAGEFEVPAQVDGPIAEVPLYADGLLYRPQPDRCRYVCWNKVAIKRHWWKEHQ